MKVAVALLAALFVEGYACLEFPGADAVLVEIVGIHLDNVAVGVRVVIPAAAVVDDVIDAPYLIFTADTEPYGIVFTIFGGRKIKSAQQRDIKTARCTETIDPEGIVASVIRSPFLMVNDTRRNSLHVEVSHTVCTDNHGAVLLIEGFNEFLYGVFVRINIVGVQLKGKFAALGMVYGNIPVASDGVVALVLGNV